MSRRGWALELRSRPPLVRIRSAEVRVRFTIGHCSALRDSYGRIVETAGSRPTSTRNEGQKASAAPRGGPHALWRRCPGARGLWAGRDLDPKVGITVPMLLFFPLISNYHLLSCRGDQAKDAEQPLNPVYPDFAIEPASLGLVLVLGLTYSVIAPSIMPVCTLFFCFAFLVYCWLFSFVYTPEFDALGACWYELYETTILGRLCGKPHCAVEPKHSPLWVDAWQGRLRSLGRLWGCSSLHRMSIVGVIQGGPQLRLARDSRPGLGSGRYSVFQAPILAAKSMFKVPTQSRAGKAYYCRNPSLGRPGQPWTTPIFDIRDFLGTRGTKDVPRSGVRRCEARSGKGLPNAGPSLPCLVDFGHVVQVLPTFVNACHSRSSCVTQSGPTRPNLA